MDDERFGRECGNPSVAPPPPPPPRRMGRFIRWITRPSSRWVRIPLGLFLILFGLLGFLPILGWWMLPLGIFLLAEDIPFLRRPTRRLLIWLDNKWGRRRRRRRGEHERDGRAD